MAMTRSIERPREPKPSVEIGVIGMIIAAASLFILLPLLPFLIILWAIDKLRGSNNRYSRPPRSRFTEPTQQPSEP